jgi:hypothetical protein
VELTLYAKHKYIQFVVHGYYHSHELEHLDVRNNDWIFKGIAPSIIDVTHRFKQEFTLVILIAKTTIFKL